MNKIKITLTIILCIAYTTIGNTKSINREVLEFSDDTLLELIKSSGIKHPEIVFAQAKLETANFTSNLFIKNGNLFGMKLAKSRPTTAIGEQYSHAKYTDWTRSIADYKLWQDNLKSDIRTKKRYIKYLSNNYAEDKNYIKKLKKILR